MSTFKDFQEERYKALLGHHRFVSEYRFKLFAGWLAIYGALAVTFDWAYRNAQGLSWIVPLVAGFMTWLMWLADKNHRPAIEYVKEAGANIELANTSDIPYDKFVFAKFYSPIKGGTLMNGFAKVAIVVFAFATCWLLWSHGALPGGPKENPRPAQITVINNNSCSPCCPNQNNGCQCRQSAR